MKFQIKTAPELNCPHDILNAIVAINFASINSAFETLEPNQSVIFLDNSNFQMVVMNMKGSLLCWFDLPGKHRCQCCDCV